MHEGDAGNRVLGYYEAFNKNHQGCSRSSKARFADLRGLMGGGFARNSELFECCPLAVLLVVEFILLLQWAPKKPVKPVESDSALAIRTNCSV